MTRCAQAWADAYAEATRDPALLEGVAALAVGVSSTAW